MLFGPQGKMPTTISKDFSRAPSANIQRSIFKMDHGLKTTIDCDYLYPILYQEALPGDTFQITAKGFGRLSTPINPFMDNLYLSTYFFFVPNRIIWNNWEKFCGEQEDPGDSIDYMTPQIQNVEVAENTLYDYFTIPTKVAGLSFNNFAGRAYNAVWNQWYRDENLQNSVTVDRNDGPDDIADYVLLKKGKTFDMFTSSLPWPQKGDAVTLPLGTSAPVAADAAAGNSLGIYSTDQSADRYLEVNAGTYIGINGGTAGTPASDRMLYADLSDATAATINQLREAFQVQGLLERDARSGTRYKEIIMGHFGVDSADARLDRPEYLGGGKSFINVNPIAQTSSTDSTTPQGNMSGFGTVSFDNHYVSKSFTEHGIVLGLVCVYADLTYQQGLDRFFSKRTRYDYFWPALQHLGEQAILNQEIYAQGSSADTETFGYNERYSEYRYKPSNITGRFRSNATGTLDSWHLAQDFSSLPALNSSFIEQNVPIDRVLAVDTEPDIILDMFFDFKAARPMSMYSVPATLARF